MYIICLLHLIATSSLSLGILSSTSSSSPTPYKEIINDITEELHEYGCIMYHYESATEDRIYFQDNVTKAYTLINYNFENNLKQCCWFTNIHILAFNHHKYFKQFFEQSCFDYQDTAIVVDDLGNNSAQNRLDKFYFMKRVLFYNGDLFKCIYKYSKKCYLEKISPKSLIMKDNWKNQLYLGNQKYRVGCRNDFDYFRYK